MKKICIVTGTRAEYGLLRPVINKISQEKDLELSLVATGMHLSPEFGLTYREIESDGFSIDEKVEMLLSSDTCQGMTKSTGLAIISFSEYFERKRPDVVILLGDRFEIFACATAAAMAQVPIAHLYGGDTTEGAIDEFLRHSITKMSYLHFTSNKQSAHRVIQLGESPDRVLSVGSTGVENILSMDLLSLQNLNTSLGNWLTHEYALVTFHPETMGGTSADVQLRNLLCALDNFKNMQFIFTKANADAEGRIINAMIDEYIAKNSNCIAFDSLGVLKYLSAMKYSTMVIGNSSSGLYEAPSFKIPTVNIGDRQKGRIRADSVIDCIPFSEDIISAINKCLCMDCRNTINPYEGTKPSQKIVDTIKNVLNKGDIHLKKKFWDLGVV
ncbi:MAG: UDP-N-acetylglucosamine 2-epimerase [Oscillospiraceae bacterium]|nr:UDP-N-acetylglucosamine 2-epimerase [Oscillospiraceae bacterium]